VDQPWTPVVTLPPVRDGLRALCDGGVADVPQARHLMRNALLDFPTIVPTIACHQRRIGILNVLFANKKSTAGLVSCQTRESSVKAVSKTLVFFTFSAVAINLSLKRALIAVPDDSYCGPLHLSKLESHAVKVAGAMLRGRRHGDVTLLPDPQLTAPPLVCGRQ
jgi:hypothetical protein